MQFHSLVCGAITVQARLYSKFHGVHLKQPLLVQHKRVLVLWKEFLFCLLDCSCSYVDSSTIVFISATSRRLFPQSCVTCVLLRISVRYFSWSARCCIIFWFAAYSWYCAVQALLFLVFISCCALNTCLVASTAVL